MSARSVSKLKLAISNIAWPSSEEKSVRSLLIEHDIRGIEIAPTKVWAEPSMVSMSDANAFRLRWHEQGIKIVAAQSLLFGRPDLMVFESSTSRARTLKYLGSIIRLCRTLGACSLVFGSPKNRRIGDLPKHTAWDIAIAFFRELAETACVHGTIIGIEANPEVYGADFITCARDAAELVRQVDHPGLRLHLDTACMTLAGDNPTETIFSNADILQHFHVSQPYLAPIDEDSVDHQGFAAALRQVGYNNWISIEMREQKPFQVDLVQSSLRFVLEAYL